MTQSSLHGFQSAGAGVASVLARVEDCVAVLDGAVCWESTALSDGTGIGTTLVATLMAWINRGVLFNILFTVSSIDD